MAHDAGGGILLMEFLQKFEEGMLLFLCASISRSPFLIIATFVADADGAFVVVAGMGTLDSLGQNWDYFAIATDIVVIAGLAKAGIARGNEPLHCKGLVAATAGAVDNEEFYGLMFEGF